MKRVELYNDHFQNFKVYGIPHAQLIIADPPYNLGKNAYASNPAWYKDGDNKNGESELAGKEFFDTDKDDVIIDPCAGSGSTLLAAMKTGRRAYGFEIKKDFYKKATEQVLRCYSPNLF